MHYLIVVVKVVIKVVVKPLKNLFLACTVRWNICWYLFRIPLFYLNSLGPLHAFQSFISSVVLLIILQLVVKCLRGWEGVTAIVKPQCLFIFLNLCNVCSVLFHDLWNLVATSTIFISCLWIKHGHSLFLDLLILLKITNLITAEAICLVPVIQLRPSQ